MNSPGKFLSIVYRAKREKSSRILPKKHAFDVFFGVFHVRETFLSQIGAFFRVFLPFRRKSRGRSLRRGHEVPFVFTGTGKTPGEQMYLQACEDAVSGFAEELVRSGVEAGIRGNAGEHIRLRHGERGGGLLPEIELSDADGVIGAAALLRVRGLHAEIIVARCELERLCRPGIFPCVFLCFFSVTAWRDFSEYTGLPFRSFFSTSCHTVNFAASDAFREKLRFAALSSVNFL